MKILHVVPCVASGADGVSYCVPGLCEGLADAGCEVELHTLESSLPPHRPFKVVTSPRKSFPRSLGRSPEMYRKLREACATADIVHGNSLWMMPNIYPWRAARGTRCKFVLQPHGTLAPWALRRSRWKKLAAGIIGQFAAMRAADMWVATSDSEYSDIRARGFRKPAVVLPIGIDVPGLPPAREPGPRRRMFFLGRIHPVKNIETLLRCWARLENRYPDWDLSIAGPCEANPYADRMRSLAAELGCRRVAFEGEIKGDAKFRFMAGSDCLAFPSHTENFAMSVAEALACGVPAICSRGTPWSGLAANECGWWVSADEDRFLAAMEEAMSAPRERLAQMGARGREWMKRDFSWKSIASQMKQAYAWLLGRGDKPSCVRED